jgi:hypothetical protein
MGVDELLEEQGDVLASPAQGRQIELHHLDAVVEVPAEGAVPHLSREIAVGRGDHAHVGLLGAGCPERLVLPLLKHAQQPDLQGLAYLANLVEEQGPAARQGEATGLVLRGPREGAGLVPEQLRFEQGVGQRPAVDGHEGTVPTGAQAVNGARHQLLAGAGLALDQDGAFALRDAGERLDEPPHGRAAADDVPDLEAPPGLSAQLLDQAEIAEGLGAAHDRAVLIAQDRG